ncbi:MAG TPA: sigma-70 family RNA polymerase sigma factor [Bryobacteraceae bacterium]
MAANTEITTLLAAVQRGDRTAESILAEMVYGELHAIAKTHMRRERHNHTLQTTALVNEAYLRLVRDRAVDWQGRAHFFACASVEMRRILVDYARQRAAGKRPDAGLRIELKDWHASERPRMDHMLMLDEALNRLAELDARQARIVEMRYFGGLTEKETAEVLGISIRTVKRDWTSARAWLQMQLRGKPQ